MRITCFAFGTQGDVLPFIALGRELKRRGHEVRLTTHATHKRWVQAEGIEFGHLAGNPQYLFASQDTQPLRRLSREDVLQVPFPLEGAGSAMRPLFPRLLDDCWKASADTDFILFTPFLFFMRELAAQRGIPCAQQGPQPSIASSCQPSPWTAWPRFHPSLHRLHRGSHVGSWKRYAEALLPLINDWRRKTFSLPPLDSEYVEQQFASSSEGIYFEAYSPVLVPRCSTWGSNVYQTGAWHLKAQTGWMPPGPLDAFLKSDGAPVAWLGLGTATYSDVNEQLVSAARALRQEGFRLLVQTEDELPLLAGDPGIFQLARAPHDLVFPLLDLVVHQGGAGTVHATVRAQVPSVVIAQQVEQWFWGRALHQAGLAPPPLRPTFAPSELRSAVRQATANAELPTRLKAASEQMQLEPGCELAAEMIEGKLGASHRIPGAAPPLLP